MNRVSWVHSPVECQVAVKSGGASKGFQDDEIVIEVNEVEQQDTAAAASEDAPGEAAEEIPQGVAIAEVPPTAEEVASA